MIRYKKTNSKKWPWKLTENYSYKMDFDVPMLQIAKLGNSYVKFKPLGYRKAKLELKEGYSINGANIIPDSRSVLRGAFVHDAGWQLIEESYLPKSFAKEFDKELRGIFIEDGMNKVFANICYIGVRIGAKWRFGIKY